MLDYYLERIYNNHYISERVYFDKTNELLKINKIVEVDIYVVCYFHSRYKVCHIKIKEPMALLLTQILSIILAMDSFK